jgi:class 3 adenylate cyclase
VTEHRVQRRLAAILAADVVGYSALMQRAEEATYTEFERLKREVIEPGLSCHDGRLIKTTGDGALAEFASPSAAVRCAVEIQEGIASGRSSLKLRIGVNLGEVIVGADGDLFGDGINIAVRLEGVADPGGILISEKVYSEVEGKLEVGFEDRGDQQLKNISKPVRAFAVRAGAHSPLSDRLSAAPSLPDKPSIAVLPFENMSGDPEQEYFADGIHHQIAERTRQEFKAEALEGKRVLAAKQRELDEKAAALDQTISERLAAERVNLSKELEVKLRSGFSTEIADLKRQANERSERLAQAQAIELELRTEKRNLEEREKARDLEMARKLDKERVRIQLEISTRLEEEHARQVAEKDKRLSDAMKANDELRRKLQQGSQQLQGEVLELALEDLISQTFPSDLIQPVPKGINGADIIQRVQNPNGDLAGSIIWESKRTKAWSDGWIQKIKDDQRQAKADIAIMVSDALPKDCSHFKQIGGIWVTHPRCAIHLASALRLLLLEVASAKRAAVGKNEKMEIGRRPIAGKTSAFNRRRI